MPAVIRNTKERRQAIVAVEFLLSMPAFLIPCLFVVEFSLIWADRHIMRLAAYRAAKAVIKTRAEQGIVEAAQLCWVQGSQADDQSREVQARARRAASKVMAIVAPTMSEMLPALGLGSGTAVEESLDSVASQSLQAAFGEAQDSDFVGPMIRMLRGLPSAWLLTEIGCQASSYEGSNQSAVELTVTYHRPPRMPYVNNVMWLVYWMGKEIKGESLPDKLDFIPINPLTYGIDVDAANSQLKNYVAQKTQAALNSFVQDLKDRASKLDTELKQYQAGSIISQVIPMDGMNVVGDTAQQLITAATGHIVNWVTEQMGTILLAYPDALKFIPMSVTVRIPNYNDSVWNQKQSWQGPTPFIGDLGDDKKQMGKMAKALGETVDAELGND